MINSQTLTLGPTFFRKERDNSYSDWGTAFVRENTQNSKDARSSAIAVEIDQIHNEGLGVTRIVYNDNGHGMTEDVLRNVFFRLGETTKGTNDTGGFGWARMMTHFSAYKYTIRTQDLLVVGKGERYKILQRPEFVRGCQMTFFVQNKNKYQYPINWQAKFNDYLADCQLGLNLTINGEQFTNWANKNRAVRDLCTDENDPSTAFATVYTNKSAIDKDKTGGELLIRANGVLMYKRDIRAKIRVVVELRPEMSKTVLTSNRDGMHYQYRSIVEAFTDQLATDDKTAMTEKTNIITTVKGKGHFSYTRKAKHAVMTNRHNPDVDYVHSHGQAESVTAMLDPMTSLGIATEPHYRSDSPEFPNVVEELGSAVPLNSPRVTDIQIAPLRTAPIYVTEEQRNRLFDVIINDNSSSIEDEGLRRKVKKVIPSYNPDNWKVEHRAGQGSVFKGGNKAKLLLMFKTICHFVITEYMELYETDVEWGIGWCFGETDAIVHESGKVQFLLLNPLNDKAELSYGLRSQADWFRLLTIAVQLATKMQYEDYNARFVIKQRELMNQVLTKMPEIKKAIKKVLRVKMI